MSPRRMQEEECPDREAHTTMPKTDSFSEWEKWVDGMSKTHRQTQCKTCKLWVVWVPNTKVSP